MFNHKWEKFVVLKKRKEGFNEVLIFRYVSLNPAVGG